MKRQRVHRPVRVNQDPNRAVLTDKHGCMGTFFSAQYRRFCCGKDFLSSFHQTHAVRIGSELRNVLYVKNIKKLSDRNRTLIASISTW